MAHKVHWAREPFEESDPGCETPEEAYERLTGQKFVLGEQVYDTGDAHGHRLPNGWIIQYACDSTSIYENLPEADVPEGTAF